MVTASLLIDYLGAATIGGFLEARTRLKRRGSRLAFAGWVITTNDHPLTSVNRHPPG